MIASKDFWNFSSLSQLGTILIFLWIFILENQLGGFQYLAFGG
jgi:hypothetical protein